MVEQRDIGDMHILNIISQGHRPTHIYIHVGGCFQSCLLFRMDVSQLQLYLKREKKGYDLTRTSEGVGKI